MTFWRSNLIFCALLAMGVLGLNGIATVHATSEIPKKQYEFSAYDKNDDGYLDRSEYLDYSYNLIDYNNDGLLEESEWNTYESIWYQDANQSHNAPFGAHDLNGDGVYDRGEYLEAYDSDLYNLWDYDDDGYLNTTEYGNVATLYDNADINRLYQ